METLTYKQYVLLIRNYFRKPAIRLILGKLIATEHSISLGMIGLQFNFLCFIHFLLIG